LLYRNVKLFTSTKRNTGYVTWLFYCCLIYWNVYYGGKSDFKHFSKCVITICLPNHIFMLTVHKYNLKMILYRKWNLLSSNEEQKKRAAWLGFEPTTPIFRQYLPLFPTELSWLLSARQSLSIIFTNKNIRVLQQYAHAHNDRREKVEKFEIFKNQFPTIKGKYWRLFLCALVLTLHWNWQITFLYFIIRFYV